MSAIGPEIPAHIAAKRKRREEDDMATESTSASGAKGSKSPGEGEKRQRVMGPAMPPAPLEERPLESSAVKRAAREESDDEDEDDGFGPALPAKGTQNLQDTETGVESGRPTEAQSEQKMRRDEWMTMPPKQDDLAARLDPTRQRPRGFNTGKGAKGPSAQAEDSSAWNETPEQKHKRLQDEMMGVTRAGGGGMKPERRPGNGGDEASKRREHIEKARGPSLLDKHQKTKGADADDDPSKRTFDREKDMASGMRISGSQRKEMLSKAAGFSSKFSSGSFL